MDDNERHGAQTLRLEPLLTAKDLERLLQIDVKTIYGYVQRGLIPYVRIQSNVRFCHGEILDWIERHSYRVPIMSAVRRTTP